MNKNTSLIVQVCGVCVIAGCSITAHGQKEAVKPATISDFQSWDELDISARVAPHLDLTWVSQGRFSTQYPSPATYLSGLELRFKVGANLVVTPSYYYLAFKSPEGNRGHFNIPLFTASLQKQWERWTFSNRSRILNAVGIGTHFWIYMNRAKVDYSVGPSNWGTSIFLSDEPFCFWTFHGWTRNRFSFGGRKAINKCCVADLYYLRQDDSRL